MPVSINPTCPDAGSPSTKVLETSVPVTSSESSLLLIFAAVRFVIQYGASTLKVGVPSPIAKAYVDSH